MRKSGLKRFAATFLLVVHGLTFACHGAYATDIDPNHLPDFGNVINGNATFERVGNKLIITLIDGTIIEWNGFNVGSNMEVHFNFANGGGDALNRDFSGLASQINGLILSNGNLIFVNNAGIVVGITGNIQTANLILSTLNITNQDFLSRNYVFKIDENAAKRFSEIINEGNIQVTGGYAALIGSAINNKGKVAAPFGTVALASGDEVRVIGISNGGEIGIEVVRPVSGVVYDKDGNKKDTQISSTGSLEAGLIVMEAQALPNLFHQAINLEGVVVAHHAVVGEDGKILIKSRGEGSITSSADISADHIEIDSDGAVSSDGRLVADTLIEKAYSFHISGYYKVGQATFDNLDGAINLGTGSYSGDFKDLGDIIIDAGAIITLNGDVRFMADTGFVVSDADGIGRFHMNAGSSIVGNGHNLLVSGSQDGNLGSITGVGDFTLRKSFAGSNPAYNATADIDCQRFYMSTVGIFLASPGVTFNLGTHKLTTGYLHQTRGTFNGGTGTIYQKGSPGAASGIYIQGGTFNAPTTITAEGNIDVRGGTFNGAGSTITLSSSADGQHSVVQGDISSAVTKINKTHRASYVAVGSQGKINLGDNPTSNIAAFLDVHQGGVVSIASGNWIVNVFNPRDYVRNYGLIDHKGTGWTIHGSFYNQFSGTTLYAGTDLNIAADMSQYGVFDLGGKTINFFSNSIADNTTIRGDISDALTVLNKTHVSPSTSVHVATDGHIRLGANPTTRAGGIFQNSGIVDVDSGTWRSTDRIVNTGTINHNGDVWRLDGALFNHPTGIINFLNGTDIFAQKDVTQTGTFNFNPGVTTLTLTSDDASDTTRLLASTPLGAHLVIDKRLGGAVIINSDFSVNSFTYLGGFVNSVGTQTGFVSGDFTLGAGAGALPLPLNFQMNGTGTQNMNLNGGTIKGTFTIDKAAGEVLMNGDLNSTNNVTVREGKLNMNGSDINAKNFTVEDGGIVQLFGSETVTATGVKDIQVGSTVIFTGDGDGANDVYNVSGFASLYQGNVIVNSTDGTTDQFQLNAGTTFNGAFTLNDGSFEGNGSTATFNGVTTINGGNYLGGAGTQTFNTDLNINGGAFTGQAGTVDLNADLNLAGGAFTASSGTTTLAGDLNNTGGTFGHNGGGLVLDGADQAINGSNVFNDLTKIGNNTLTVQAGSTQTIAGNAVLQGTGIGAELKLRSSNPGTVWFIDPQGARNISFVDVQDSTNLTLPIINPVDSIDSGNTTNWFPAAPVVPPTPGPTPITPTTGDETLNRFQDTDREDDEEEEDPIIPPWGYDFLRDNIPQATQAQASAGAVQLI